MNPHDDIKQIISESLNRDLTNEERARVTAHIMNCSDCRTYYYEVAEKRRNARSTKK